MRSLGELSPTEFENLTFDLLRSSGMKNVQWRTPGSDGGRDIECEYSGRDFAGGHRLEKWFVDAKRYQASVAWPVVWEKISYADALDADFLLIVATSSASPQCIDNINSWNKQQKRPVVRFWSSHDIMFRLRQVPYLLAKYELKDVGPGPYNGLEHLQTTLHRLISAANDSLQISGSVGIYLDAANGLSELIARSYRAFYDGKLKQTYAASTLNSFTLPWLHVSNDAPVRNFDAVFLKAVFPMIALSDGWRSMDVKKSIDGNLLLTGTSKRKQSFPPLTAIIADIDAIVDCESSRTNDGHWIVKTRDKK